MKTRNQVTNRRVAQNYSVRAITLVLALSLVALIQQPALALDRCATWQENKNCSIDSPSSTRILVNKARPLQPNSYVPRDLVKISKFNPRKLTLRAEAASALVKLGNAMKSAKAGTLIVQSAYRSYSSQKKIHRAQVRSLGKEKGEKLAARPGYSEHQTGFAVDLGASGTQTLKISFAKTKAGRWLEANAYRFGYVLRYPKGKTPITGYQFEPWHFRYVGVDLAYEMHSQKVETLEEYYQLEPAPKYLD